MNQARAIHVVHVIRMGTAGGMETGIVNVANGLDPGEFRITLVVLDSIETYTPRLARANAHVILEPKRLPGVDWSLIPRLARQFRKLEADLVFSHNWGTFLYAVMAARIARIPVIHGEHGKNLAEVDGVMRFRSWCKRRLGTGLTQFLAVSEPIRREGIEEFGMRPEQTTCILNGVDTSRFRADRPQADCRARFGMDAGAFWIGSVSRLDPVKNYPALIEAVAILAAEVPRVRLALAGDGVCLEDLRRKARAIGIEDRVVFLGRRPDVEYFLPALDVFALPSFSEGMPNTVIEAMACGVPVVCSNVAGHTAVVDPGVNGLLAGPPCDGSTLARSLRELVLDAVLRKRLGEGGEAKVKDRYTLPRMIEEYAEMFRRCVSRNQSDGR